MFQLCQISYLCVLFIWHVSPVTKLSNFWSLDMWKVSTMSTSLCVRTRHVICFNCVNIIFVCNRHGICFNFVKNFHICVYKTCDMFQLCQLWYVSVLDMWHASNVTKLSHFCVLDMWHVLTVSTIICVCTTHVTCFNCVNFHIFLVLDMIHVSTVKKLFCVCLLDMWHVSTKSTIICVCTRHMTCFNCVDCHIFFCPRHVNCFGCINYDIIVLDMLHVSSMSTM